MSSCVSTLMEGSTACVNLATNSNLMGLIVQVYPIVLNMYIYILYVQEYSQLDTGYIE